MVESVSIILGAIVQRWNKGKDLPHIDWIDQSVGEFSHVLTDPLGGLEREYQL